MDTPRQPLPRIMMVSSEASPWAKSGGLADVVGALPAALAKLGHSVCVVIPHYMDAGKSDAVRVISNLPVSLGGASYPVSIWSTARAGVTTFFVEQPGLVWARRALRRSHGDFPDNHIRFALLAKAALEISRRLFPRRHLSLPRLAGRPGSRLPPTVRFNPSRPTSASAPC